MLSNCTEIPTEIIKKRSYWFVFIYIHNSLLKHKAEAQRKKKKVLCETFHKSKLKKYFFWFKMLPQKCYAELSLWVVLWNSYFRSVLIIFINHRSQFLFSFTLLLTNYQYLILGLSSKFFIQCKVNVEYYIIKYIQKKLYGKVKEAFLCNTIAVLIQFGIQLPCSNAQRWMEKTEPLV